MTVQNNILTTALATNVAGNVVLLPVILISLLLADILLGKKMDSF